MPYALEQIGQKGWVVVNTQTGKHYSKKPIPKSRALAQMRLLYAIEHGVIPLIKKQDKK